MKIFTLVFSIYLLSLSVLSCADGLGQNISIDTAEITTSHQDHNHTNSTKDNCTPFCICSCCGTFLVIPMIEKTTKISFDLASTYQIHYTFDYLFDYSEGIWHPPSIV